MPIDWASLLYDPIYAAIGVPARLTLDDTAGTDADLTAIDDTAGLAVSGGGKAYGAYALETIRPVATVRARQLAGLNITHDELSGATITLHAGTDDAKTWRIESHQLKPSPQGELAGEIMLILIEPAS